MITVLTADHLIYLNNLNNLFKLNNLQSDMVGCLIFFLLHVTFKMY